MLSTWAEVTDILKARSPPERGRKVRREPS